MWTTTLMNPFSKVETNEDDNSAAKEKEKRQTRPETILISRKIGGRYTCWIGLRIDEKNTRCKVYRVSKEQKQLFCGNGPLPLQAETLTTLLLLSWEDGNWPLSAFSRKQQSKSMIRKYLYV